jgi:hypothetical protein
MNEKLDGFFFILPPSSFILPLSPSPPPSPPSTGERE